jgi:hypothetical protein
MSASYPTPTFRRTALAPGILAAIVCIAGVAAIGGGVFTLIQYLLSILALIISYFAWEAKQWWWIPLLLAIAVLWNPILPFSFSHDVWLALQYVASLVFIAVAIFVKVRIVNDKNAARSSNKR